MDDTGELRQETEALRQRRKKFRLIAEKCG
jgi:hypothetical protein